ncbi:hypothetical protein [Streptomyces sp. NBC_01465]|uniref:hypothetical protein n=1 Tax=Streptomyces sp. NBC_01465 TaxID=2903878 RepID=UPI002E330607|nr:hypothetical protein [Streptomyces sp. NBC_01465]
MSMRTERAVSRRSIPLFFLGVGAVSLVAAVVGGRLGVGLVVFGVMALCSFALVLMGRRSETYQGLTEDPDERFASMGKSAWAVTGAVLTLANFGGLVGELAGGGSGSPFFWLVALGGVAYVGSVGLLRNRM